MTSSSPGSLGLDETVASLEFHSRCYIQVARPPSPI